MIVKEPRMCDDEEVDLRVIDCKGDSFVMTVGGNLDLYWIPDNYKKCTSYTIKKDDKLAYEIFRQLFCAVRKRDDRYFPVMHGNRLEYISEDFHVDEANRLTIDEMKDEYIINFVRNENEESWTIPHRGCAICFCNSGSRVPRVESLFMMLFNKLAHYCDEIETVHEREK